MSHRHLPAGQPMPGGGGPGPAGGGDMGPGYGAYGGYGGQGNYGGHRGSGRRQQQYMGQPSYHTPGPPAMPYGGYMNPYPNPYYPQVHSPYQNTMPGYMGYQAYNGGGMRSPPIMPPYTPMAGVTVPPYVPHHQQSPALATPYQPPPIPVALPPQTPTSTHSSQVMLEPSLAASQSPAVQAAEQVPAAVDTPATPQSSVMSVQQQPPQSPEAVQTQAPFRPPLPWYSRPDLEFPKSRRIKRSKWHSKWAPPTGEEQNVTMVTAQPEAAIKAKQEEVDEDISSKALPTTITPETPGEPVVPAVDQTPRPGTSGSNASGSAVSARPAAARPAVPAIPAVPVIPAVPRASPQTAKATAVADAAPDAPATEAPAAEEPKPAPRAPPSSWSALFAGKVAAASKAQSGQNGAASPAADSADTFDAVSSFKPTQSQSAAAHSNTVAAAVQAYQVGQLGKLKYIKPRGLVNSGNMCYMNSILQALIYCTPFYDFLDQVGQKASHSFKSQTPILDAMILFLQEFPVISSAETAEKLHKIVKKEDITQYGDSFIPEFIYQAIEPEKRFENMRRGHQQDAQEFFGLLLQSLEDECSKVMGAAGPNGSAGEDQDDSGLDGWLEVGSKQKAAVTRSSGARSSTPINRIFGGMMRSELIVTGRQNSITSEPYQSLALDVGADKVRNVVDAIKHLTYGEKLEGLDFDSNSGRNVSATKQTLIDTLPPVLILHLKRFQFDATGGTSKIWKKIGYPLELDIPQSALSKQWKARQIPKYKLVAVVYHHGRQANGGHYTVDVRRQDDVEWIRLDDTNIRRVSSEDVVGEEETAKGGQQGSSSREASTNRFGAMNEDDSGEQGEWTSVDKANGTKSPWKSAVNGTGAQQKAKAHLKESVKDNKVAYLLFYKRV